MPKDDVPPATAPLAEASARALLDELLTASRLYTRSTDYQDLLDFVVRLRNFAPFNAMLLQIQKPGLRFAAAAHDWQARFGRRPKEGVRPLLILWPFGPVALVYDVQETEGAPVPQDVTCFIARGPIDESALTAFAAMLRSRNIECAPLDAGDGSAGWIRVKQRATTKDEATRYLLCLNRHHEPAVRFVTLAHELGHLFLGHLGSDGKLRVPDREHMTEAERELEAESVAYLVARRNGIESRSHPYLSTFVAANGPQASPDVYQVMRATGQVENILGLSAAAALGPAAATGSAPALFD